jgi:hypothetical protein
MVFVTSAVESHHLDASIQRPLCDQLTDNLGSIAVTAIFHVLTHVFVAGADRDDRAAHRIIDQLATQVAMTTKDTHSRSLSVAPQPIANGILSSLTTLCNFFVFVHVITYPVYPAWAVK